MSFKRKQDPLKSVGIGILDLDFLIVREANPFGPSDWVSKFGVSYIEETLLEMVNGSKEDIIFICGGKEYHISELYGRTLRFNNIRYGIRKI